MPARRFTFRPAVFCAVLLAAGRLACAAATPFSVKILGAEDGLPQSSVISIIQTRDGYLWLGTLNGLVRFDGSRFTVFNSFNTPELGSDRVVFLFEDRRTNLWVGTDLGGVAVFGGSKINAYNFGRASHEGRLVSAAEDAAGAVWLYTADARLARYRDGVMDAVALNLAAAPACRLLAAETNGAFWLAEDRGVYSFRPADFSPQKFSIADSVNVAKLDFMLASRNGGTWRLFDGHVTKWAGSRLEKDFGPYPWNARVTAAVEDADGRLVVGTLGGGVFWMDADGAWERIGTEQGLSSGFVLSLCVDFEGSLWVGTDGDGLNRVRRKIFQAADGRAWPAQSAGEDAHGGLWTAFNAHGASLTAMNVTRDFAVGRSQNAWAMLVDRRGRVWAGTRGEGLFQFSENQFSPAPGAEILGAQIFALFEDRAGKIWAGTQNGLAVCDGTGWKMITPADGLPAAAVRAIAEDAAGNLWAGTEGRGVAVLRDGKVVSRQTAENGLPGDDVSCLFADAEDVLWAGTFGHGLGRFQNGRWTAVSTDDGLVSNSIGYVIEDTEGNLWVGSNAGLMRVAKNSLADFAAGRARLVACRVFGQGDGLPSRECSVGSQPSAFRSRGGKLFFPTTKGLAAVNPSQLRQNLRSPKILIESVLVDGREQKTNRFASAWPPRVAVPPGGERLDISYAGLNFSAPEQVRFRCRLERAGRRAAWTDLGGSRAAHFNCGQFAPGEYFFHIVACNEDGTWSGDEVFLAVTVLPEFWQTGWFRALAAGALLVLVAAGARYFFTLKLQRQLQSLEQQKALEHERARIARDLHDQLGANLTQIALLGELAEEDRALPDEITAHAQQISQTARETTRSLDEIVWAANPANDTLEGLANYACKYAQDYLALAGLRCRLDAPAQLPDVCIPPEVRHNAFLAFKEAVHNAVKHARAAEVWIRLREQPGEFIIEVEDDGRGCGNADAVPARNGLRNMKKRMADIGGGFSISPGATTGTRVRLKIPLAKRNI